MKINTNFIYNYLDYRTYLLDYMESLGPSKRGFRSLMADKMGCQKTFISQVLSGDAHFNLDHGASLSELLGHTEDEAHFLMLLIAYARAGSKTLRQQLQSQIKKIQQQRMKLKERFKTEEIASLEVKVKYYSSWLYGAVRVLTTIPAFRTRIALQNYFQVPPELLSEVLNFLVTNGLITETNGQLQITEKHLHLDGEADLVKKHHTNWRIKSIASLDNIKAEDLHYSGVHSLSKKDALKVREIFVKTLEDSRNLMKDSPEECLQVLCMDWFSLS